MHLPLDAAGLGADGRHDRLGTCDFRGLGRVSGSRFGVQRLGFKVQGLGLRV